MNSLETLVFYAEYCRALLVGTHAAITVIEAAAAELEDKELLDLSGRDPVEAELLAARLRGAIQKLEKATVPPAINLNIPPPPPWKV